MVSTIVKQNVKFMISSEEGGMRRFAMTESMGGNASSRNGKLCVVVNFWFEAETGQIVEFTNENESKYSQGIFRLEILDEHLDLEKKDLKTKKKYPHIIEYQIKLGMWSKQATPEAEAVIRESMKLYNQCCDALERKGIFKW